mgnify:CR=1 FL=1
MYYDIYEQNCSCIIVSGKVKMLGKYDHSFFFNFVIEHIYKPLECIYLLSNSQTKHKT